MQYKKKFMFTNALKTGAEKLKKVKEDKQYLKDIITEFLNSVQKEFPKFELIADYDDIYFRIFHKKYENQTEKIISFYHKNDYVLYPVELTFSYPLNITKVICHNNQEIINALIELLSSEEFYGRCTQYYKD